jgi:hypothetical protein
VRDLTSRRVKEEWMFLLDIAFRSERDVLATEYPHLGFELLLLRLANAQGLLSLSALEAGAREAPAPAAREAPVPAARPVVSPAASQGGLPSSPPPTFSRRAASDAKPARGAGAEGAGLWDALKRAVEAKKGKGVILMGLLNQMAGETRGEEFVISCPNGMFLDRLKEPDKWSLLLSAMEEAAGRPVPVRLEASAEKKSPETDAVAETEESLERKALSDPVVLEALRVFDGAMLVKVNRAPAGSPAPSGEAPAQAGDAAKPADAEGNEESPLVEAPAEEEEK